MQATHIETIRIAGELRKAIHGPAWHGPALFELLADVSPSARASHPIAGAHSIEDIVRHLATWLDVVRERLDGQHRDIADDEDWPSGDDRSAGAWQQLVARIEQAAGRLAIRIEQFPDDALGDRLPGAPDASSAYATLHGSVQHVLYHAGQIAVLKKGSGS